MLQRNLDNEQFSSLQNLRAIDYPRHSLITTDRPDSSQLVDLHVYIVPKTVWKDGQRLAQNEAMDDAVSAGFVRVPPNTTIRNLRKSIEQLCGSESYFPRDFIYLRSVGRCLTKVKPKQEEELKVKNYRPPQTFAPEIYLLEEHEERGEREELEEREERNERQRHIPDVSSPLSAVCDICGTHDGHRGNLDEHHSHHNGDDSNQNGNYSNDIGRSPSRLSPTYRRSPMRGGKHYPPAANSHDMFSRIPSSERHNRGEFTPIGSDPDDSSINNLSKLKEEQERLRRRQAELERMRRAAEQKQGRSRHSDGERSPSAAEDEAATRIQASYRGFKDRQDVTERKRNDNGRTSDWRRSKLGGNNNEFENTRNEISNFINERIENADSNRSPLLSIENQRTESQLNQRTHSKTQELIDTKSVKIDSLSVSSSINENNHHDDEHTNSNKTVNKLQQSSYKSLPMTTPEIKPHEKTRNDEIDAERREAESKRRRQLEEEEQKKKAKDLEEQRRKELAKRQRDDPESLRARHQEIRVRRIDLEKVREEVIKHLKNIHNRITLRRKEARDLWKKKYFNEKKKHPPLDERIATLKNELEQIHKKTIQTIESEAKYASQMGYTKEAETGNCIAQITRIQHDIQDIRHQVEQAKLRLTTDVKLRNQAETECRSLKHELNQAKTNLNDIKSRVGP